MTVKANYVEALQNFQYVPDIRASTWTFRTIGDLCSVGKKSTVLSVSDRVAILGRGVLAIFLWLPVNLIAIPHVFILGALQRKNNKPPAMRQLHEIIPGLFLGTSQAATKANILQQYHITSVLSILDSDIEIPELVQQYLRLPMEDYPHVDLKPIIEEAYSFVTTSMEAGHSVLVHCNMGKSRSASIMVALVQKIQKLTPQAAFDRVSNRRPVIGLNYGFKKQVLRLEVPNE